MKPDILFSGSSLQVSSYFQNWKSALRKFGFQKNSDIIGFPLARQNCTVAMLLIFDFSFHKHMTERTQYSTVVDNKNGRTVEPLHEKNRKSCFRAMRTLLCSSGFTHFDRPSNSEHRCLQPPSILHLSTKILGGARHERHRSISSPADSVYLIVLVSFSTIFSSARPN